MICVTTLTSEYVTIYKFRTFVYDEEEKGRRLLFIDTWICLWARRTVSKHRLFITWSLIKCKTKSTSTRNSHPTDIIYGDDSTKNGYIGNHTPTLNFNIHTTLWRRSLWKWTLYTSPTETKTRLCQDRTTTQQRWRRRNIIGNWKDNVLNWYIARSK